MKTERESFDLWFKKNFHDLHEAICCGDLVAKNYKKAMFKAWQARVPEGYVVAPVDKLMDCLYQISDRSYVDDNVSEIKAMLEAVEK